MSYLADILMTIGILLLVFVTLSIHIIVGLYLLSILFIGASLVLAKYRSKKNSKGD